MTPELIAELSALSVQVQAWLMGGALVFARVGPLFALAPAFGERVVPARIRLMAALATSVVVTPAVAALVPTPAGTPLGWFLYLASESLIGLILGMALRLMILALMMAGTKAAQATSLAQAFGGAGVDPQPALAQLLVMAGLCAAAMSGLPERLVQYMVLSYEVFPAGSWPTPGALAEWGTARVARAFALAFSLAAPFVIGAGLYNLALGAINRAMPQLMVAFVGAPALTWGGLVLMALTAPIMLGVWLPAFLRVLANPVGP